ncbi:CoA pyrophosphatase, partial [Mycobacterium tuberculosis]
MGRVSGLKRSWATLDPKEAPMSAGGTPLQAGATPTGSRG